MHLLHHLHLLHLLRVPLLPLHLRLRLGLRLVHLLLPHLLLLRCHLLHTPWDHNLLHLRHRHALLLYQHTLHLSRYHASRALCNVRLHARDTASTAHLLSHLTLRRLRRLR